MLRQATTPGNVELTLSRWRISAESWVFSTSLQITFSDE